MADTDKTIDQLNSYLKGEISAAETYRTGIDKLVEGSDPAKVAMLQRINDEHGRHIQMLRERVTTLGGTPADTSGPWGTWANTVMSTASLLGDAAALKALKEGEEHGAKDYERGLDDLDAESKTLVQGTLMPNGRSHISVLDRLIEQA